MSTFGVGSSKQPDTGRTRTSIGLSTNMTIPDAIPPGPLRLFRPYSSLKRKNVHFSNSLCTYSLSVFAKVIAMRAGGLLGLLANIATRIDATSIPRAMTLASGPSGNNHLQSWFADLQLGDKD